MFPIEYFPNKMETRKLVLHNHTLWDPERVYFYVEMNELCSKEIIKLSYLKYLNQLRPGAQNILGAITRS